LVVASSGFANPEDINGYGEGPEIGCLKVTSADSEYVLRENIAK
jgi:hypothetical protein